MAHITPFKGIFYDTDKIHNLSDVVTPPYDVISEKDHQRYYDRHPQNIVRLILGDDRHADSHQNIWQNRAADFFKAWCSRQILVQDKTPALYLTALDFLLETKKITRYGFVALVDLEPFEKKIIIPHEKTFSKIKSERLELMKACHANFSPIFSLYSDQENVIIEALKQSANMRPADIAFSDEFDHQHRLWRITDSRVHRFVTERMEHERIFIADGHHRYETALNYRQWLSQTKSDFSENHPANRVMMYLCSMEDPGLIILPAHRILKGIDPSTLSAFIEKCKPYFDIATIPVGNDTYKKGLADLISALRSGASNNTIGVFKKDRHIFYLLTLKSGAMEERFDQDLHPVFLDLDVVVLTRLILMEILGFDQAKLDDEKVISYLSSEERAVKAISEGDGDIALLLNPTKIHQIRSIAGEGLTMPRKATYFYPKVITGMVINDLGS